MRSLTQYFLALMAIPLVGTFSSSSSTTALPIIANTFGFPSTQSTNTNYYADVNWSWSIQVGSGSQAFSPTLTSLAAPIANGSGAGQLVYGNVNILWTSNAIYVYQTVYNYSQTTITVTEVGLAATVSLLYINSSGGMSSTTFNGLLSYDTFSVPITLPYGSLATFQISLEFSG
jgi:hypothetical protein